MVEWEDEEHDRLSDQQTSSEFEAPKKLPPIFDGSSVLIYRMFDPRRDIPKAMTITGNSSNGPFKIKVPTNEKSAVDGTLIHKGQIL